MSIWSAVTNDAASVLGSWYPVDSFCGNSDKTADRLWPVRRPPAIRLHVALVRGREISHEFVARWHFRPYKIKIRCVRYGHISRAEDHTHYCRRWRAAFRNAVAAAAAAAIVLLWLCAADAAETSCDPGTTAACTERDGIPFPVTTTAVAADRTAIRRARWRQGTPPFTDTAPDPPWLAQPLPCYRTRSRNPETVFVLPE